MNNDNIYLIEQVAPKKFSNKDWETYFLFRKKCTDISGEKFIFENWENLKVYCIEAIEKGIAYFYVWKNDEEAGHFSFDISFKNDSEKRFVYFRNSLINKSLEANFLKLMFEDFLKFDPNSNLLAIESINGANNFVQKELQGIIGAHSITSELKISEAKRSIIDEWCQSSRKKFDRFRIEFYTDLPKELLDEFCSVFTTLLNDMPANSQLGDFNITPGQVWENQENGKKNKWASYRYLVFNEKNQLIAKTNVAIIKTDPPKMTQYMTGVLKEYRGLGISKWLKAEMFQKLVKDFPTLEKITTATHPNNHPSRELSKKMGYKKTGEIKEYLVERKQIISFIEQLEE